MSGFFDTWGSEGASERAKEKEKKGQDYVEKPISMVGGKVLSDAEADARYAKTASKSELAKVQQRRQEATNKGYASTSEMAYAEREDKPTSSGTSGTSSSGTKYYTTSSGSSSGKTSGGLTDNPAYTPGSTIDLSGLKNAIGSRPEQVLNLNDYKSWIDKIANAGGADVTVDPARFQDTTHLAALFKQMQDMLAPQTQAQKDAANSAYGSAANQLDNKWASRGLLASGAAAAQQQQGANSLAQQMAGIEANQQANAMNLGLNYADLGLRESDQRFNQQMSNRQFDLSRATSGAGAYMSGLGFQEQQLQNYLNNMKDVTGMEMNQNQWSQEFGLNRQNADFNRWLQSNNFYEGQRQFDENLGQRQYEFDKNYDLSRDQFDFSKDQWTDQYGLQRDQFNEQRYQYDKNYAQNAYQFDKNYALQEGQLTGNYKPTGVTGLMSQLGSLKQQAMDPANAANMSQYKAAGDDIRNTLQLMGIDTSNLGSNVSVADYYKNAGAKGIQTLPYMQYEQGKINDQRTYEINQQNANTSQQNAANSSRNTDSLIAERERQWNAQKATGGYVAEILSLPGKDAAMAYLGRKAESIANEGVNINDLLGVIMKNFGNEMSQQDMANLQKALLDIQLKQQKLEEEGGTSGGWQPGGK